MNSKSLLLVALVATISSFAQADSLQFTGAELSNIGTARIQVNGGAPKNVGAGRLKFSDGANTILTYCFDAESPLNSGVHSYSPSIVDTNSANGLGYAGRIIGNYFSSAVTNDQQAGLQLAIWSAIYDANTSFTENGANFKVTNVSSAVIAWANTYYQGKDLPLNFTTQVKAFSTQETGGQSQLTVEAVPEPASMLALTAGLAALARKRKQK